jgi:hypothetical protein
MLDQVLALRRLKKPPARWDVGGEVRMNQPSVQCDAQAEAPPASSGRPGLPDQRTPRPRFALGPWRAGAGHLASGRFDGTWSELLRAVTDALSDGFVDRLSIDMNEGPSSSEPIRVTALRGLDPLPFFLAYSPVSSSQRSSNLSALSWHLWRPESVMSYDKPDLALLAPTDALAVATWRAETPFNLARAICYSLHLLTGTSRPGGVVHVTSASGARREELDHIERLRRTFSRHQKAGAKPVRGHCRACGHALRDAASIRRGYGPECWERVSDHRRVGLELAPDLPAHYWAGALPISALRRRIRAELA